MVVIRVYVDVWVGRHFVSDVDWVTKWINR